MFKAYMEITNKSDQQFPRSLDSDLKIRITLYYRKLPTLKIVVFYVCHLADVLLIKIQIGFILNLCF